MTEINFPKAMIDSEISACFLLNEHGDDLYFLLLNNSVYSILFNLKKL